MTAIIFSLSANNNGFSNLTRKLLIEKIKGFFDRFEIQIIELYHNNKCAKRVAWITIFLGLMKNSRKRKQTNGSAVYSFSLKYFSIFKTKKKKKLLTISKEVHNKFILPTHVLGVENLLVDSLCIYFCGRSKKKCASLLMEVDIY